MRFEWDRAKAVANLARHKVSFVEAVTVFFDPLSATVPDPDHSFGEHRFVTMGMSTEGRLLVVSHRDSASSIRIISARVAGSSERKRYDA